MIENEFEGKEFHAYFFVYDASDRASFLKLYQLIETVLLAEKSWKNGSKGLTFNTRKVVIANKADLKLQKHILTREDKDLVGEFGRFDASALTNFGINEVMHSIVSSLVNDTFVKHEL